MKFLSKVKFYYSQYERHQKMLDFHFHEFMLKYLYNKYLYNDGYEYEYPYVYITQLIRLTFYGGIIRALYTSMVTCNGKNQEKC